MSYTPKRCSFCSRSVPLGNGVMFIRNDGATFWFCSTKCKKNSLKLKRDPRKLKWARSKQQTPTRAAKGAMVAPLAAENRGARASKA